MRYFISFLTLIFSPLCVACDLQLESMLLKQLASSSRIIRCDSGDANGDGIADHIVWVAQGDAIRFAVFLSPSGNQVRQSIPMIRENCQGSCWVESVYFKNSSIFIQANEKTGDSMTSKTYQFKLYDKKLKLIGVRLSTIFPTEDSEYEELIDDINWLTGSRIKTTKYPDGRKESVKSKMATHEILFESFDLGVAPPN